MREGFSWDSVVTLKLEDVQGGCKVSAVGFGFLNCFI